MENGDMLGERLMNSKCVIVTGANRGIGFQAALKLAKEGARIILGCRDLKSAAEAKELIENQTQNNSIVVKKLDLASFKSIEEFAADMHETEDRVDVLINNAGVLANSYRESEDGYELHFGINYLGHFLLTNLLLDLLKKSAPSRIIHVSSIGHRYGHIHWDDLNMKKGFNGLEAYSQSKLMNILFSLELSKRLEGTGVTSNSLHPGAINTDIFRETAGCCKHGGCIGFWISLIGMCSGCMSPASKGAETVVYCAVNPELESTSGRYFRNRKIKREAAHARNIDDAERLWQYSEKLTNLTKRISSTSQHRSLGSGGKAF